METKICIVCGKELPLSKEYFSKRKDSKDGFRNNCKICANKYKRKLYKEKDFEKKSKYYQANKTKILQKRKEYYCENKETVIEYQKKYYSKNKDNLIQQVKRYQLKNKDKVAKRAKQYRERNKDKIHLRMKKYAVENKDKYNLYNQKRRTLKCKLPATLTTEQWGYIKQYFDNRCAYCGNSLPLEQEHFIPLSKGGEYTLNNIIPACKSCNSSKRNLDFFKWYPKQDYYSKGSENFILDFLGYDKEKLKII